MSLPVLRWEMFRSRNLEDVLCYHLHPVEQNSLSIENIEKGEYSCAKSHLASTLNSH